MPEISISERYAYGYLIGAIAYVLLWALIFWRRPDLRREMMVMSALSVLYGLPHEYFLWTRDWWHPPTITGTRVGLEDLLYAIGNGGTLAVLYAVVFRRRLVQVVPASSLVFRLLPYLVNGFMPPLLVAVTGLHSFIASGIGALLALAVILRARPDLIRVAVGSAVIGTLVSLPFYGLMEGLLPGFIASSWYIDRLSGILLLGIPIEDLIWYFYTAMVFGTYYKLLAGWRVAPTV
jgi:hypothetical protein